MNYNGILKTLAPCGLNCVTCAAFSEGDIKKHASELKRLLGPFDGYAERSSAFDPNLKQRWLKMNIRMKEIGVEAYFEETRNLPRYV